jgi:hypothetical protein
MKKESMPAYKVRKVQKNVEELSKSKSESKVPPTRFHHHLLIH